MRPRGKENQMKNLATMRRAIGAVQYSRPKRRLATLGLAGLLSFAVTPGKSFAADRVYSFKVVTTVGSAAPGGGAFVSDFEPTALNNRGQLAFTSESEVPGEEAVFLAGGGTIQQIMRFGQSAPGGGTFSVFEMGNIGLNDAGDAAFGFSLDPLACGPPINGGLYRWSQSSGTLSATVIPNVTPEPNGGTFVGINFGVTLNNKGDVAFTGYVTNTPTGPGQGFFVQSASGSISTIARTGDASSDGGMFLLSSADTAVTMNDVGDVAFQGNSTLDPAGNHSKLYFRRAATGKIQLIPQPTGVVRHGSLAVNNRDDIVFGG